MTYMLILCVIWVIATWNGLITHTAADHRCMMWQIYGKHIFGMVSLGKY